VAHLIARGLADKEIAVDLGISEETVGFHLRNAFQRYQVHSRAALVVCFLAERGPGEANRPYTNV
jgi:two-component system NarL family response regulator